jgi:hypothetical protein
MTEFEVFRGLVMIYAVSGSQTVSIITHYFCLDLILSNMILTRQRNIIMQ